VNPSCWRPRHQRLKKDALVVVYDFFEKSYNQNSNWAAVAAWGSFVKKIRKGYRG
jgi:hypothetical protein